MSVLLLVVTLVRISSQFNAGPRIFVANLALSNLVHALCGLLVHGGVVYPGWATTFGG